MSGLYILTSFFFPNKPQTVSQKEQTLAMDCGFLGVKQARIPVSDLLPKPRMVVCFTRNQEEQGTAQQDQFAWAQEAMVCSLLLHMSHIAVSERKKSVPGKIALF